MFTRRLINFMPSICHHSNLQMRVQSFYESSLSPLFAYVAKLYFAVARVLDVQSVLL